MDNLSEKFKVLLKKKGTGETMGKHLFSEDFLIIEKALKSYDISDTRKATMLTAISMLSKNDDETQWLAKINQNLNQYIPQNLHFIFTHISENDDVFYSLLNKVLKHEDLSISEFNQAMDGLFSNKIKDFYKAIFLEGERLKRESTDENITCFNYFWNKSKHINVDTPYLVDLSLSYDGFTRHPLTSLFLAPLLASIGVPTILHSALDMSPKFGITPHKLLNIAKKNVFMPLKLVKKDIENTTIGWGFVDQSVSFPELHKLKKLRTEMIKRPIIATIEKVLHPIHCINDHYLVTGYTHPPYKDKMIDILNEGNKNTEILLLRGVEGSAQAPLDRRVPVLDLKQNQYFSSPEKQNTEYPNDNTFLTLEENLTLGTDALQNKDNYVKESILYFAELICTHFKLMSSDEAKNKLKTNLENGKAYQHWLNACND